MSDEWLSYLSHQSHPHLQVEHYLRLTGWREFRRLADAVAFESENGKVRKLIPINTDFDDYNQSLYYEIQDLCGHYSRDLDELLLDIFEKAETFRFRFKPDLRAQNNISWLELTTFTNNVRDMVANTGKEIDLLVKYKKQRVDALLKACQFGQTQPGSFIVKLFIPRFEIDTSALKPEEQQLLAPIKNHYHREVSSEIFQNYKKLSQFHGAKTIENEDAVDFFVTKHFSLSKSVSSAIESNNDFLEIQPRWSGWSPQASSLLEKVIFTTKDFDWLPQKIEHVHKRILSEPTDIIGHVLSSSRDIDSDGNTKDPYIRIRYKNSEGQTRIARLEVTEDQYSQALDAAKPNSRKVIGIRARITKRPKVDLIFKKDIESYQLHELEV